MSWRRGCGDLLVCHAAGRRPEADRRDPRVLRRRHDLLAIFEQAGVSLSIFAKELTQTEIGGYSFPSAWFLALNSLFVILLAPLFAGLWTRMGAAQPSSPVKFALGLGFLAASFLLMVPAALLTAEGKVSPWWLVGLYFLQTVGELLLSPVGLSTMTKLAPVRATGLVLGGSGSSQRVRQQAGRCARRELPVRQR